MADLRPERDPEEKLRPTLCHQVPTANYLAILGQGSSKTPETFTRRDLHFES
jgi:hypothetical protein